MGNAMSPSDEQATMDLFLIRGEVRARLDTLIRRKSAHYCEGRYFVNAADCDREYERQKAALHLQLERIDTALVAIDAKDEAAA